MWHVGTNLAAAALGAVSCWVGADLTPAGRVTALAALPWLLLHGAGSPAGRGDSGADLTPAGWGHSGADSTPAGRVTALTAAARGGPHPGRIAFIVRIPKCAMLTWTWVLTCKCVAAWVPQQKMCGVGDDSLYCPPPLLQYDDPSSVAARVLQQKMYGDDSLYFPPPPHFAVR